MIQEDLRRWFKEKWTSQSGEECGSYSGRGRVKCRPSKRISEKSPQTWGEMSKDEKEKAVRKKQEAHRQGKQWSSHKTGKTWDGPKNKYRPKSVKEETMKKYLINKIIQEKVNSKTDCGCVNEEKKPYKGFVRGKNHPEGGLSRAEAKRQGIHAGIETKDEAERKGGFGKLSSKTQARRKSFCSRMCGMKRKNTSSKTANDPDSKINASLRVWGCRCGANESFESQTNILTEANKPTNPKLWSKAKSLARKKFDVYPSAYANGWAAKWYKKHGGRWKKSKEKITEELYSSIKRFIIENAIYNIMSEEIVNQSNAGTMTPNEISSRDRIAKGLKNVKSVKRGDSLRDAKFRLATYIQLKKRGKESKSKKKSKKK